MGGEYQGLCELFYWDSDFVVCFLTIGIHLVEVVFDLFQDLSLEVLLSAVLALLAWHIIDDHELSVVFVDILYLLFPEILIPAKVTYFVHNQPRS